MVSTSSSKGAMIMISKTAKGVLAVIAAAMLMPAVAMAVVVAPPAPSYSTFGPLPAATFGGSGIPNDPVAIRTITDGAATITLGLSAHTRSVGGNPVSPIVTTNDGAGTYFAPAGSVSGQGNNAMWNFDFYTNIAGGTASNYTFTLSYDFNPGPETSFGTRTWNGSLNVVPQIKQGSENLGFDYLGGSSFDPNALGLYTFTLNVVKGVTSLGQVSMNVNAVPLPAAAWLLGSALLGLVGARRLKRAPDAAFAA